MSRVPEAGPAKRPDQHSGSPPREELDIDEPTAAAVLAELRQEFATVGAPDDILDLLNGPGDPVEILQRLIDAGVVPSPADSLAALVAQWEPLLEPDTEPLEAELFGAEFLALVRQDTDDPDDLPYLLATLVEEAEQYGDPAALAMLRVLAVLAPDPAVRAAAGAAAGRLAAAGVPDCHWAARLGAPKLSGCFGTSGAADQQVVAVGFRYRRRRHAFAVLIDHRLGGGVRDVWVTDQPEEIRVAYQDEADQNGGEFADYDPAAAHAVLDRALARPPCPVEPDQVENLDLHLDLLRRRMPLLVGDNRPADAADPAALPAQPPPTG
jgi:hypothetical protein